MSWTPNLDKEAAAEPGSDARIKALLYLSRRPQGGTVKQVAQGTGLPENECRCALNALTAPEPDTPPRLRREGKPAVYYVPLARERLPRGARTRALVPGMVEESAQGGCAS